MLVRWIDPERGMISPGDFIPVFEQNGFIMKLDYYVWEKTCQLLRRWLDEGRDILESLPVLRVYMGHVTILSTLYYVHLLPERVRLSHAVDWQRLESIIPEVES